MYSQDNKSRFETLTAAQRELTVAFVSPNGEAVTDMSLTIFFDLIDSGTIEFAQAGSPNEHLHVPDSDRYCAVCAYVRGLVAA